MALAVAGHQVKIEDTGHFVDVPDGTIPRLMYYLSCVESVTNIGIPERLRDYQRWRLLSSDEKRLVIELARQLSPDVLQRANIFIHDADEKICVSSGNEFVKITDTRFGAMANSEVFIAGASVRVVKVMFFTRAWLEKNFIRPMCQIPETIVPEGCEEPERRSALSWNSPARVHGSDYAEAQGDSDDCYLDDTPCRKFGRCCLSVLLILEWALAITQFSWMKSSFSGLLDISRLKWVIYGWMIEVLSIAVTAFFGLFAIRNCRQSLFRIPFYITFSIAMTSIGVALILYYTHKTKLAEDMSELWNADGNFLDERNAVEYAYSCSGWKEAPEKQYIEGYGLLAIPRCYDLVSDDYALVLVAIAVSAIIGVIEPLTFIFVICTH
jgi:hypothetical protein